MAEQVFVHLISVVTVDIRLGHRPEGNTVVTLAECGAAGVILRFLASKLRSRYCQTNPVGGGGYLVARETEDNKPRPVG